MEDTRTLADLAREALAVQDASNLSGVVHGFSRAIRRLRQLLPDAGTEDINDHAVCLWWVDKLADLTRRPTMQRMSEAYDELVRLSQG